MPIALFYCLSVRFPNLAVCNITRDSIRAALVMGITADQVNNTIIVSFIILTCPYSVVSKLL